MSYRVKTQLYSGPFDLLLSLVMRQKVDIGALSLTQLTDQYLEELERMGEIDLEIASDFVLIASTLLDIKAKSLIPQEMPQVSEDDIDDEFENLTADEAREVLIARLIAYKQFRNAAASLGSRMELEGKYFYRSAGPDQTFLNIMPDYLEGITLRTLAVMCANLDGRRQSLLLEAEHIAPKRIPLAYTVLSLDRMTMNHKKCTFMELLGEQKDPEAVVVTFLALLELFKRGSVDVRQNDLFGTIEINRREDAVAIDEEEYRALAEEL